MKQKLEKEVLDRMFENNLKMKKIKSAYTALLFMSAAMLFLQGVMFVLGALNVAMLEGIFMNIIVFLAGTGKFDKYKLLYVLMAVNILAGAAFIVFHPVSEMLFRLGVLQHFYLALETYIYIRIGGQKEALSWELGYPYFTELAEYEMKEKDYEPEHIPENAVSSGHADMEQIQKNEVTPDLPAASYSEAVAGMDEISLNEIPANTYFGSLRKEEYNTFREQYDAAPEDRYKEIEFDRELLNANKKRKNRFDAFQRAVFIVDVFLLIMSITNFGNVFENPFEIFKAFPVIAVIIASVITVTCLENRNLIKYAAWCALAAGLQIAVITLDISYIAVFAALALQMWVCSKLSEEQEYLKSQFGYPYFLENQLKRQYVRNEYIPEHRINFEGKGMDEIR